VHKMCSTIEALGLQQARAERDQARAWAKAWKLAAKSHRSVSLWRRDHLHRLERIVSDG